MDSVRRHYAFRFHAEDELLDDPEFVLDAIVMQAKCGGATVLESHVRSFTPQGVTAFALLAESHISIHTWPEEGVAELDVFTCGETIDPYRIGLGVVTRFAGSIGECVRVDTSEL